MDFKFNLCRSRVIPWWIPLPVDR